MGIRCLQILPNWEQGLDNENNEFIRSKKVLNKKKDIVSLRAPGICVLCQVDMTKAKFMSLADLCIF